MFPKIAKVVVGLPVEGPFDYLIPPSLSGKVFVGSRAKVFFHHRKKTGYVVGLEAKSRLKPKQLKSITDLIDTVPVLNETLLKLAAEFSQYYGCSLGEAVETILPEPLRKGRPVDLSAGAPAEKTNPAARTAGHILCDTTPAGWSHVLEQIRKAREQNKSVLILVPETHLVDWVKARLLKELSAGALNWDHRLSAKQELETWTALKTGQARLLVGTRSAVFAPLDPPGLIIVFEEENSAYKQEQSPSYHVRDVALMRSRLEGADVIFMSEAPSAELWSLVSKKKVRLLSCPEPAPQPQIQIVDMANYKPGRGFLLSVPLRNSIEKTLSERGQTILFMNRKGFTTRTQCSQCGYVIRCERCDVNLVYLYSKKKMVCRICHQTKDLPKVCPQCKSSYLKSTGMGVEKLESEVARIFPQARVEHYDSEMKDLPARFDILITTQAVLREKERLSAALAGVINIDPALNRADFRAAQKTFSLLTHLKQMVSGKFVVQTRIPDTYCLKAFRKNDPAAFYRQELRFRKETELPPYRHLAAIGLRGVKEDDVFAEASLVYEALEKSLPKDMELAEPHADLIPKMRDKYRFTIILKGKAVKKMLAFVKKTLSGLKRRRSVILTINVD